jgi:hypothetical protein
MALNRDYSQLFLPAGIRFSKWQRVLTLSNAIPQAHTNMPSVTSAEQSKREELRQLLLTNYEVTALREIVTLLEPAAAFTHWAGGTTSPTISQVYFRIYSLLPTLDSFDTTEAKELHGNLNHS